MEPVEIDVRVTTSDGEEWSFRGVVAKRDEAAKADPRPRRLAWNLFLIALLGLAIAVLLAVYTDAFSAVAAALGLGGVFVWVAFLKGIVSDDRKAELQSWFESSVLLSKTTPVVLVLTLAGLILVLTIRGTIVLDATGDSAPRMVVVRGPDHSIAKQVQLTPSSRVKLSLPAVPPKTYHLEVRGLPVVAARLFPWTHEVVYMPTTFFDQPLTIIRIPPDVANTPGIELEITVRRGKKELTRKAYPLPPYGGRPLWVGCDRTVPVPEHMKTAWRTGWTGDATTFPRPWDQPPDALLPGVILKPEDVITAWLRNAGKKVGDEKTVTVKGGEYHPGSFKEIYFP